MIVVVAVGNVNLDAQLAANTDSVCRQNLCQSRSGILACFRADRSFPQLSGLTIRELLGLSILNRYPHQVATLRQGWLSLQRDPNRIFKNRTRKASSGHCPPVREKQQNFMMCPENGCGLILESIACDFNEFRITAFRWRNPQKARRLRRNSSTVRVDSHRGEMCAHKQSGLS